jgi:hypothetical protein
MELDHPVMQALRAAHAALDAVTVRDEDGRATGWLGMDRMTPSELAEAVRLEAALEGRAAGLRLHTVATAEAGGTADQASAADTSAWAAAAGRNRARSWGGVWLAELLESKYHHTFAALADGRISEDHAAIIVRVAEQAPEGVSPSELADCEARMVAKAERLAPERLRRAARRLLEPLSKRLADTQEGHLLVEEEDAAERYAALSLTDNGDGTWSGRFTLPELHAQMLKKVLDKLASPRRYIRTRAVESTEDPTVPGYGLSAYESAGRALMELIEHLPETGHARSGITLVVHVEEENLRAGIGAATLETGGRISNEQVRRLACEAQIMPMVMGGKSLPLDLGTAQRLFTKAQSVALSALHDSCAAEGCDRPTAWCELHHRVPWGMGGPTDLENAAPLCGYHHRRVHDPKYEHQWLADGTVRFRHRWPSRWPARRDPWADRAAA